MHEQAKGVYLRYMYPFELATVLSIYVCVHVKMYFEGETKMMMMMMMMMMMKGNGILKRTNDETLI